MPCVAAPWPTEPHRRGNVRSTATRAGSPYWTAAAAGKPVRTAVGDGDRLAQCARQEAMRSRTCTWCMPTAGTDHAPLTVSAAVWSIAPSCSSPALLLLALGLPLLALFRPRPALALPRVALAPLPVAHVRPRRGPEERPAWPFRPGAATARPPGAPRPHTRIAPDDAVASFRESAARLAALAVALPVWPAPVLGLARPVVRVRPAMRPARPACGLAAVQGRGCRQRAHRARRLARHGWHRGGCGPGRDSSRCLSGLRPSHAAVRRPAHRR